MQRSTRRTTYFWLMGTCLVLILLAWNVVRLWSTTLAVAMSVVAAVLPPTAAIIANMGAFDPAPDDADSGVDGDVDGDADGDADGSRHSA